jgi:hypothetical protein
MAKFSQKMGGREVGQAKTYAAPHDMSGKATQPKVNTESGAKVMDNLNVSIGTISKGNYPADKTSGIKIRGTGAATKGVMARGPMG